jgi:ATP-dependent Clp protease ATP-binding subunit ClpX
VFIDEIDKIGRKSESASLHRDVSGEGVQQALLKMVEGTKCRVTMNGNKKHPALETVEIDTSNILFIAGGAFEGIDGIIDKRLRGGSIGFTNTQQQNTSVHATPEDFMLYGMIPEFVGRFPVTVPLSGLDLEDLTRILVEPKNSLLAQMQFFFQTDGIDLTFEDSAVIAIAQRAHDMNIGARGLKTVLETIMMPLLYNMNQLKKEGIKELSIDESMITNTTN